MYVKRVAVCEFVYIFFELTTCSCNLLHFLLRHCPPYRHYRCLTRNSRAAADPLGVCVVIRYSWSVKPSAIARLQLDSDPRSSPRKLHSDRNALLLHCLMPHDVTALRWRHRVSCCNCCAAAVVTSSTPDWRSSLARLASLWTSCFILLCQRSSIVWKG